MGVNRRKELEQRKDILNVPVLPERFIFVKTVTKDPPAAGRLHRLIHRFTQIGLF